jgi:hypothetical protein
MLAIGQKVRHHHARQIFWLLRRLLCVWVFDSALDFVALAAWTESVQLEVLHSTMPMATSCHPQTNSGLAEEHAHQADVP